MSNTVIAILTFAVCLGAGLLILRPVLGIYVDSYAVRVKPKKESDETAAEKPKDSALLMLCKTVGELILSVMPAVADKRTVELLTQANYRTPDHLAIYIGIRSIICGMVLGLGFLAGTTNPINLVLSLPAAVLAWLIPNFFLAGRAKKRQADILRELPIVIDLMLVCAQAGHGVPDIYAPCTREHLGRLAEGPATGAARVAASRALTLQRPCGSATTCLSVTAGTRWRRV